MTIARPNWISWSSSQLRPVRLVPYTFEINCITRWRSFKKMMIQIIFGYSVKTQKHLGRNPPEGFRVTRRQKLDCLHHITNLCATVLNTFSYRSKTKSSEGYMRKPLKVLVKWNWWWNFTCDNTISQNFEIYITIF